jgi:Ca-activated chloride channel family protein
LVYVYPLTDELKKLIPVRVISPKKILVFLRLCSLALLIFIIGRPQTVDDRSSVNVQGIPMELAIDISGSMQCFDDLRDRRSRLDIAKKEAIRFIEKRTNDPIGIVFFAGDVLSRCPLTLDKNILKEIVASARIGDVDPNGTQLSTGLAMAVSRLRLSDSKNKVAILLTDGLPNNDELSVDAAIAIAQKFCVKVYTIGVGSEDGGFIQHAFGIGRADAQPDMNILEKIASETGGKAFHAHNSEEMRAIYDTIDSLEKTEIETNMFHNYHEIFMPFLLLVLGLIFLESFLRFIIWRGVI